MKTSRRHHRDCYPVNTSMKLTSIICTLLAGCSMNFASESEGCPSKPDEQLKSENVEEITLSSELANYNPSLLAGEHIGYRFAGRKGQQVTRESDNACIWIFSPQLELVNGNELPEDGRYIAQISRIQGSGNVSVNLGLDVVTVAQPTESPTPTPTVSPSPTPTPTLVPTPTPTVSPTPTPAPSPQAPISEQQAVQIVQGWLDAKPRIFAPPFDESLLRKYIVNSSETFDKNKLSGGSMGWLRDNKYRYSYAFSKVASVVEFPVNPSRDSVSIRVEVYEDLTLYDSDNIIVQDRSGRSTNTFRYVLAQENGTWKIYEYYRD